MEVREIPIDKIQVEDRKRVEFGNIEELAGRIHAAGGLFNPLLVEELPGGNFKLVAGERRLRAVKFLKHETVPVHVKQQLTPIEYRFFELSENLDRKEMEWYESVTGMHEIHLLLKEVSKEDPDSPILRDIKKDGRRWGYRETCKHIGTSLGSLSTDIKLAKALKAFPQLRKMKSKESALSALLKMEEELLMGEIGRRLKEKMRILQKLKEVEKKDEKIEEEQTEEEDEDGEFGALKLSFEEENKRPSLATSTDSFLPLPLSPAFPGVNIINEDCLKVLPLLPARSIDCIITDLPWGIDKKSLGPAGGKFGYNDTPTYVKQLVPAVLPHFYRVLKLDAFMLLFCGFELECWFRDEIERLNTDFHLDEKNEEMFQVRSRNIVWTKNRGGWTDSEFLLSSAYEAILLAWRGKKRLAQPHSDVFYCERMMRTEHAGEKPVKLLRKLIQTFTYEGEMILDPFCGLGATLIAAGKKGRFALGIERDVAVFGRAVERGKKAGGEEKKITEMKDEEMKEEKEHAN